MPRPVPVFMSYFTAAPSDHGVRFRPDPYNFDDRAIKQMFESGTQLAAAGS
jgi:murein L,D-transpeptidase YcbB/YkuD